jgi:hypothetical protein
MGGPLSSRQWSWAADEVDSVRTILTQNQPDALLLAEVEILARGSAPIRLFTDHAEGELAEIVNGITQSLRGGKPPPTPPAWSDHLRRMRER